MTICSFRIPLQEGRPVLSSERDAFIMFKRNSQSALTHFSGPGFHLVAWGDPAHCDQDAEVRANCRRGLFKTYWGRSWIYVDRERNEVAGCTDRLGLFPILYRHHSNQLTVTSDRGVMLELLGDEAQINPQAMLDLLAFGQVMDEQSIMRGVTQLRASRCFHFSSDGQLQLRDFSPYRLQKVRCATLNEAVDAFVGAVDKCFQSSSRVAVSLSGGLDSRLILAAALKLGHKPVAFSYGCPDSSDMRIARDIAESHGLPFFAGDMRGSDRWASMKRIALRGGCEVPVQHGHALADETLLDQTRGFTVITGTGAETFRAFYYDRGAPGYSLMAVERLASRLLPYARRYIREEFGKLANPVIRAFPELGGRLEARFQMMLDRYHDCETDAADLMDNVYLAERVGRMVVSGQQLLDNDYERCHPFLHPNVLETLGALPVRLRLGSLFHRKAIAKLSPSLASVDWDKTGRPLRAGLRWRERYPGLAARLGRQPCWGKASSGVFDYTAWLDLDNVEPMRASLLQEGLSEGDFKRGVDALLTDASALHVRGLNMVLGYLNSGRRSVGGGL
ncbi:asparagine synthase-related protein [Hahella aquimaris]|uniref:asparagine synthase-related protein n=1 Tax=Hahella sp. HNIBRBA332 TaxID=3015983 RepID=UPI00273B5B73|nr:asparagine synthase-related protein [Hahella sp. HNIBRBA332]WLQ16647.1 asparagine synthase-related protein [Hahella sp. HNIBRBA332]